MLAIRMQRTGRKGHAQYRLIVQDSRLTPTSGKLVYKLGSYNPHTKQVILDKEKAQYYLDNGAQPSPRITLILKNEGVKLPSWVKDVTKKESTTKNPEKLRKNQPKEEVTAESSEVETVEEVVSAPEAPVAEEKVETKNPEEVVVEEVTNETEEKKPAAEATEEVVEETKENS